MPLRRWWSGARKIAGAPQVRGVRLEEETWLQVARDVAASGGRLLTLWACADDEQYEPTLYAAYLTDFGVLIAELALWRENRAAGYPGLDELFPVAGRLQRAVYELSGVAANSCDRRPWLDHSKPYPFVSVAGEGVHEIGVGPVHAGTIEPGHFRFSVVGEKVLRLEAHLGYVHKGLERRFRTLKSCEAYRLAARISGDSSVAFSWAYCQALEGAGACVITPRAAWLRAVCLELERLANHLGDLGALGNDAGFGFAHAQFSRVKEQLLRAVAAVFAHRYMFDVIVPGGVAADPSMKSLLMLLKTVQTVCDEAIELRAIYDDHEGLRDRFTSTGRLEPQCAARLGVLGLVARASAQALDARVDMPWPPYDRLALSKVVSTDGDVAARVSVRFDELAQSRRMIETLIGELPGGRHICALEYPPDGAFGVGLIEGWRGPVMVALHAGPSGSIRCCHPHDPSWQAWPALEYAVLGNIVPDFPLINKSFNLSYSGVDL